MFELRPYQKEICKKAVLSMNKYKRTLIRLPTGGGKTIIAAHLIKFFVEKGFRLFYVVNREELVSQSNDKFHDFRGQISIIKAGTKYKRMYKPEKPVQIVMVQTFFARIKKLPDLKPDYIIFDEAHEGFAGSRVKAILEAYPNARILGKTATPCDSQGWLLQGFDNYIQDLQLSELQDLGYLVHDRVFAPINVNLDGVKTTGNDYHEGELSARCSEAEIVTNIVENFEKFAKDKQTLIFAVDIYHAERLTEKFKEAGYKTEVIHSKMDNPKLRDEILDKFAKKEIQILINVAVLTTGFDSTGIECVVFARPTKVLRLFLQMAGRGLRTNPAICPHCGKTSYLSFPACEHCHNIIPGKKTECLFLDCGNCLERFGFPSDDRIYEEKPKSKEAIKSKKKALADVEKIIICLTCKAVNKPTRKYCIECGELLNSMVVELDNEADLTEYVKPEIEWSEIFELIKLRNKQIGKGHNSANSIYGQIKKIRPESYPEGRYKKMVLTKIKQCAQNNYKPWWVVEKLKERFGVKQSA